ncbi:MFS transporter [Rhodoligotrophos defluvii]|uniref:MFS transporter n=1 Tax=Rhodoligotrophos defluvii TaxID=2561934 RepID=UPI0014854A6D|nr:MFS transporter [Rhodoligotrophos defluvii]
MNPISRATGLAPIETRFRWVILCVLFSFVLIVTLAHSAIAQALDPFLFETDLADEHRGLLLAGLGLGFIIASLPAGLVCDGYGARRVFMTAALLVAAGMLLGGLSTRLSTQLIACLLVGFGTGAILPAVIRSVADWFSPHEHAFVLGSVLAALPFGLGIAALLMPWIIAFTGWRPTLWGAALLVLAWLPLWTRLYTDDPAQSSRVSRSELQRIGRLMTVRERVQQQKAAVAEPRRSIAFFAPATLFANTWAFMALGFALFFTAIWFDQRLLPHIATSSRLSSWAPGLPWLIAAPLIWLGGFISDRRLQTMGWLRQARTAVILASTLLATIALACLAAAAATGAPSQTFLVSLICAAIGLIVSALPVLCATIIDISKRNPAAVLGFSLAASAGAGVAAPVVSHWIGERTGHPASPFLLLLAIQLATVVVLLVLHKPDHAASR